MFRRVVTFGGVAVIFVTALLGILLVLDVITVGDARRSLARTLGVIAVATAAIILMLAAVRVGRKG